MSDILRKLIFHKIKSGFSALRLAQPVLRLAQEAEANSRVLRLAQEADSELQNSDFL
jgi:hypothetical protein